MLHANILNTGKYFSEVLFSKVLEAIPTIIFKPQSIN